MRSRSLQGRLCGMALLVLAVGAAAAQTPVTYTVHYWIHEEPENANSPVTFKIMMSLERMEVDGDSAGWKVQAVEFRLVGTNNNADSVWVKTTPVLTTSDGLWWVTHADPDDPQRSEFTVPPALEGVADAANPNDPDLEYEFEGHTYTPPQGGPPYQVTGTMTQRFAIVVIVPVDPIIPPWPDPDEPVEILHGDPPTGGC